MSEHQVLSKSLGPCAERFEVLCTSKLFVEYGRDFKIAQSNLETPVELAAMDNSGAAD